MRINGVTYFGRSSPIFYAIDKRIADPCLASDMRTEIIEIEAYVKMLEATNKALRQKNDIMLEGIKSVRDEIQVEIQRRPQASNLGKKGCVRRLEDVLFNAER